MFFDPSFLIAVSAFVFVSVQACNPEGDETVTVTDTHTHVMCPRETTTPLNPGSELLHGWARSMRVIRRLPRDGTHTLQENTTSATSEGITRGHPTWGVISTTTTLTISGYPMVNYYGI